MKDFSSIKLKSEGITDERILKTLLKYEKKDFYKIYIDFPRNELIEQINSRASEMIDRGAILEVKKFIKLKISKSKTASKAIGISEIKEFLNKKIQISELIEKIYSE